MSMMRMLHCHLIYFKIQLVINFWVKNSIKNILPVRSKYIAKSEVPNQLNIFVFESGICIIAGVEFVVPSELI